MLTSTDYQIIDRTYFDIIEATPFYVVLRSKSTGHFWHLLEQDFLKGRSFYVSHKHHAMDFFHPQTCRRSIKSCCQYIKNHDEYHLIRKSRKKKRKPHRDHKGGQGFSSAHNNVPWLFPAIVLFLYPIFSFCSSILL